MKIVILMGSPNKNGSTRILADSFVQGAESAGHSCEVIDVCRADVHPCTGCVACMRNGGDWIYHDDMKEILEVILISDVRIWSYPLYCYGMPAPLKALLDRTLPLSGMAMQKVGTKSQQAMQKQYEEKSLSVSSDPASRKKPKNSGFLS